MLQKKQFSLHPIQHSNVISEHVEIDSRCVKIHPLRSKWIIIWVSGGIKHLEEMESEEKWYLKDCEFFWDQRLYYY